MRVAPAFLMWSGALVPDTGVTARKSDDVAYIDALPPDYTPSDVHVRERKSRTPRHLRLVSSAVAISVLAGGPLMDANGEGWERRGFVRSPPENEGIAEADLMAMHHRWEVQAEKGMAAWFAAAKGIPLPPEELRTLDRMVP